MKYHVIFSHWHEYYAIYPKMRCQKIDGPYPIINSYEIHAKNSSLIDYKFIEQFNIDRTGNKNVRMKNVFEAELVIKMATNKIVNLYECRCTY